MLRLFICSGFAVHFCSALKSLGEAGFSRTLWLTGLQPSLLKPGGWHAYR
jgi:hypothetical protein